MKELFKNNLFKSKSRLTKGLFIAVICLFVSAIIIPRFLLPLAYESNYMAMMAIPVLLIVGGGVILVICSVRWSKELGKDIDIFKSKSQFTKVILVVSTCLMVGSLYVRFANDFSLPFFQISETAALTFSLILYVVGGALITVSGFRHNKEIERAWKFDLWCTIIVIGAASFALWIIPHM
jgi:uncharacterized membrane protein YidH (DUF202 family)